MFVRFSVQNLLSERIVLEAAMNDHGYGSFWARVTRPDGRIEKGPKVRPDELVSIKRASILPSRSHSVLLLANKWFDFDLPGEYTLEVGLQTPLRNEAGVELPLPPSGRLVFVDKLQRICEDLENDVMTDSLSSFESTEILSRVRDPVAVPFLANLLRAKAKMAAVLTDALERIADSTAVDVLISYINDDSEDRRESSRAALAAVARQTHDPAIRRKIAAVRK
jgi:hypothetical protein